MNVWQQLGIVLTTFLGVFLFAISTPNLDSSFIDVLFQSDFLMTWIIASLILIWGPGFGVARIRRGFKNR